MTDTQTMGRTEDSVDKPRVDRALFAIADADVSLALKRTSWNYLTKYLIEYRMVGSVD